VHVSVSRLEVGSTAIPLALVLAEAVLGVDADRFRAHVMLCCALVFGSLTKGSAGWWQGCQNTAMLLVNTCACMDDLSVKVCGQLCTTPLAFSVCRCWPA
jgi:hypothetical protein